MIGTVFTYLRWAGRARRNASDPEALAGWCLIHKKSYRTSSIFRPALHLIRRCIAVSFFRKNKGRILEFDGGNPSFAIWDNRDVSRIRYDHIVFNGGELPRLFIARDQMQARGAVNVILIPVYFLFLPFLCCWSLFAARPRNIAMLYDEWNEAIGLLQTVVTCSIQRCTPGS